MIVVISNWLRVLDTAKRSQINQRVCQQLHGIMPPLQAFKAEQQSRELVFPRKGTLDSQVTTSPSMVVQRDDGTCATHK
jgi:hypothetical protein